MASRERYELVRLRNGVISVRCTTVGETMHPGFGPQAEANALYVEQLKLSQRLQPHDGEFVFWDIGLGAAANAIAVLSATKDFPCRIRLISFDRSLEPLRFALEHAGELVYLRGYEASLAELVRSTRVMLRSKLRTVDWEVQVVDFPSLIASLAAAALAKPHAILFDPFSPAPNPAMWTQSLFDRVFRLLDPDRPCMLATYSRSTMLRVALLL